MFPRSHIRTMRTRNQTKFKYISVPYGHVLVPLLHILNAICLPILPWPRLSCASHQKPMDDYFCQGEIEEPVYDRIFSYHPLLKNHKKKEHDNANLHPTFTESIEQHTEK